jgi:hypothetical protein
MKTPSLCGSSPEPSILRLPYDNETILPGFDFASRVANAKLVAEEFSGRGDRLHPSFLNPMPTSGTKGEQDQ